jgi:hypothetical protein
MILADGLMTLIEVGSWKLVCAAKVAATTGPTKPNQG